MVQDNARHGADSYWYSLEHQSKKSVFNLLFPTDRPADTEAGIKLFLNILAGKYLEQKFRYYLY